MNNTGMQSEKYLRKQLSQTFIPVPIVCKKGTDPVIPVPIVCKKGTAPIIPVPFVRKWGQFQKNTFFGRMRVLFFSYEGV